MLLTVKALHNSIFQLIYYLHLFVDICGPNKKLLLKCYLKKKSSFFFLNILFYAVAHLGKKKIINQKFKNLVKKGSRHLM